MVMAYLPGEFGAQAIAQVLSGAYNPSGRLPFTWPREASSHVTYDRKGTENVDTDFEMTAFRPQYAFGHGLNYSEVKTTGIRLLNKGERGCRLLLEPGMMGRGISTPDPSRAKAIDSRKKR